MYFLSWRSPKKNFKTINVEYKINNVDKECPRKVFAYTQAIVPKAYTKDENIPILLLFPKRQPNS